MEVGYGGGFEEGGQVEGEVVVDESDQEEGLGKIYHVGVFGQPYEGYYQGEYAQIGKTG